MGRAFFGIAVMVLLFSQSGCRSGCNRGCGLASMWGNSTISPPGTYSLNIPGQANQNYYAPGNNQTTATPNSSTGWNQQAAVPGQPVSGQPVQNQGQQQATWNGTSFQAPAQQAGYNPTNFSIASGNGVPTNQQNGQSQWHLVGGSQIVSPDFATTRIDERMDPSRMPVADATAVRAPGTFNQMPNATRLASASMPIMQNPGYSMPNAVRNSAPTGMTQWNVMPNGTAQQPQWVLAEASTRDLSRDANFQAGWRETNPNPNQGTINR
jgi:hypothetical protein